MKNTNASRDANGRFSESSTEKALRVEVWLQPSTIQSLDQLCSEWNVGRGKVIDHVIKASNYP